MSVPPHEQQPAPAPSQTPVTTQQQEARRWAMLCHLSALVGLLGNGIGFLLAPLIVWLIKKDSDPFVDDQGKEAVNFQITMLIGVVVGVIAAFFLVGFILLIAIAIMAVIFPIIAAIKANDGVYYRYPLTIRFIK